MPALAVRSSCCWPMGWNLMHLMHPNLRAACVRVCGRSLGIAWTPDLQQMPCLRRNRGGGKRRKVCYVRAGKESRKRSMGSKRGSLLFLLGPECGRSQVKLLLFGPFPMEKGEIEFWSTFWFFPKLCQLRVWYMHILIPRRWLSGVHYFYSFAAFLWSSLMEFQRREIWWSSMASTTVTGLQQNWPGQWGQHRLALHFVKHDDTK